MVGSICVNRSDLKTQFLFVNSDIVVVFPSFRPIIEIIANSQLIISHKTNFRQIIFFPVRFASNLANRESCNQQKEDISGTQYFQDCQFSQCFEVSTFVKTCIGNCTSKLIPCMLVLNHNQG